MIVGILAIAFAAWFVPWLAKKVRIAQHEADAEVVIRAAIAQRDAEDAAIEAFVQDRRVKLEAAEKEQRTRMKDAGEQPPDGWWACIKCGEWNDGDPEGRCHSCRYLQRVGISHNPLMVDLQAKAPAPPIGAWECIHCGRGSKGDGPCSHCRKRQ